MTRAKKSELGRSLNSLRKDAKNAGRKKNLRPCPHCEAQFGVSELRVHLPHWEARRHLHA